MALAIELQIVAQCSIFNDEKLLFESIKHMHVVQSFFALDVHERICGKSQYWDL